MRLTDKIIILVFIMGATCVTLLVNVYQHWDTTHPTTPILPACPVTTPIKSTLKPNPIITTTKYATHKHPNFDDVVIVKYRSKHVEQRIDSGLIIIEYDVTNRSDSVMLQLDGVATITDTKGLFMFSFDVFFDDMKLNPGETITSSSSYGVMISKDIDRLLAFSVMENVKFKLTFDPYFVRFEEYNVKLQDKPEITIQTFDADGP